MCLSIASIGTAQSVAINSTGDAPDSSAILDIQSTTKGVLIPRMDSTQREMIANPAEGLLVFDTDSKSFWFRQTGQWTELINGTSGLRDKDNDTKITVERTPDEDTIRFTVAGKEFAVMDGKTLSLGSAGGSIYIGRGSGASVQDSIRDNTFIGKSSGSTNEAGTANTFIGSSSGAKNISGEANSYVGAFAGQNNTSGSGNTYLGFESGRNDTTGTGNIFLGRYSGYFETGNDKLYIDNDSINTPLIYGDFNSNYATIHGRLGINIKNPDRELVVLDADDNGSAVIKLSATNSSNREMLVGVNQGSGGFVSMETNNNLDFRTNGIRRVIIDTNGDMGIGTTSPASRLHVDDPGIDGSPTINLVLEANTSKRPTLLFSETASSTNLDHGMSIEYNGSVPGNELSINAVGGNPILTVESSSRQVGINTTDPNRELTVFDSDGNGSAAINVKDGIRELFLGVNANGVNIRSMTNDNMSFWTNNVRHMTIDTNGRVGIGTTNPDRELTVFDSDGNGSAAINVKDSTRELFLGVNSSGVSLRSLTNHNMSFWTNNVQHMTIDTSGQVGIGTISPTQDLTVLDVNGSGEAGIEVKDSTRTLFLGAHPGGVSMRSLSNHNMSFWTNNVQHMTIDTSGRVGIGTKFPTHPLHIVKPGTAGLRTINLVLEANTSNRPTILFSEVGLSNNGVQNGMSIEYNGSASGNELSINAVGGNPVLTVESSSGQVGIGTTDPDRELTVFDSDGNGSAAINVKDSTRELFLGVNSSGVTLRSLTNHNMSFWTNNVRHMTIDTLGKVGIGTNNPDNELTIFDTDGGGAAAINVKDGIRELFLGVNTNGITLRSLTNHSTSFWTNNVRRMTIEAGGDVGIGIFNPTALLEVNATTVKKTGGGSWSASSDRRLKKDILDYREGLEKVLQIRPVQYHYNDISGYNTSEFHIGVIAQELQVVAPHMVSTYDANGTEYLQVDNSAMTYMLINAVKEQQALILELVARIEALESIYPGDAEPVRK